MDAVSDKSKNHHAPYRGRFAPSPTGPLHFGSLVAAVGSFLQARTRAGTWLVRIEDIDPPREVAGAAADQLATLKHFGMKPDGSVRYQRDSAALHRQALEAMIEQRVAFVCGCSRADLPASGIYPGTCRSGLLPGRSPRSVRFRVPDEPETVHDVVHGDWSESLAEACGDFVIRRADGLFAYQLAVVVDDIDSAITEVVRGADLIGSTARQQVLYRALGAAVPNWLHLPLIVDSKGHKLSKSTGADPVAQQSPAAALTLALTALGHPPAPGLRGLESLWEWAIRHWQTEQIPRTPFEV